MKERISFDGMVMVCAVVCVVGPKRSERAGGRVAFWCCETRPELAASTISATLYGVRAECFSPLSAKMGRCQRQDRRAGSHAIGNRALRRLIHITSDVIATTPGRQF